MTMRDWLDLILIVLVVVLLWRSITVRSDLEDIDFRVWDNNLELENQRVRMDHMHAADTRYGQEITKLWSSVNNVCETLDRVRLDVGMIRPRPGDKPAIRNVERKD